MANYQKIRALLQEQMTELRNRVVNIDQILQSPLPADFEEQANDLENQTSLEALEERDLNEILAIKSALARLDNNTYGVCISCGNHIPDNRLLAQPTALRCMACEQKK